MEQHGDAVFDGSTDFRQFELYLNVTGLDVSLRIDLSHLDPLSIHPFRWPLLAIHIFITLDWISSRISNLELLRYDMCQVAFA